jgi:hypothetical protein
MGIGFRLKGIITDQFATFSEHLDINQEAQVAHSFQFLLSPELQQVGVSASFDFKQHSSVVMKIAVSCHFGIENDAWHSFIEGNNVRLPLDFATNLFSITAGTTRGVLSSKTEHTPFSKFILPLLDVRNIITSDVIFVYD